MISVDRLLSRVVLIGILVAFAGSRSPAHAAGSESAVQAVAAKLGTPMKWEAQCDPASKVDLFTAKDTGRRYLARVDGGQVVLSQALTGRHLSRGEEIECSATVDGPRFRDDGSCVSACAHGPAGLRYYYAQYFDRTKQEISEGRSQYWFDLRSRDGVFLTKGVSRLLSSNLALGSGWEIWRYRENADYESGRYVVEYSKTTTGGSEPDFDAEGLPVVARGKMLVAGPDFDPGRAFADFQVVHGKPRWKGAADLSASVQGKWDRNGLAFRVVVKDDMVVPGPGIGSDHVELWFAPSAIDIGAQGMKTKASQLDTQVTVSMVDGKVVGTITFPKDREGPLALLGSYQVVEAGYVVEFRVPAESLFAWNRPSWSDIDASSEKSFFEGDLLPFTLVVSDADEQGQQKTLLSTSALKWGNPSTFGRILLIGKYGLPELSRMQAKEEL